MHKLYY